LENLEKKSKITLLIIFILTIFFAYSVKNLKFDYDFEAFFAEDDVATQFFNSNKKRFSTDNDFLFISIERPEGIFEYKFLSKVDSIVNELQQDSLVVSVSCLTNMNDYIKAPFSPAIFKVPFLTVCDTCDFTKDSIKIFSRPEISNLYVNKNATGMLIYIKHKEELSLKKCSYLKDDIDKTLNKYNVYSYHYAGRAIGQKYFIDTMQFETVMFIGMSFILIIVFLWFAFKSWWGIWIPLTIVSVSMIWITGFMGAVGEPMNLVLTVLPTIIFVVAMSDVIHLVSKYIDELRLGKSKKDAILTAYKEVGVATLLTSVTTAIGFLTLLFVNMNPVKVFGIYISLGVLFAFILAYTLLPSLLVLFKKPKISQKKYTSNFWYKYLHNSFIFIVSNKVKIVVGTLIVVIISFFGISKIETNYFLLEDLKEDNEMRQQFNFFDKEYMGLRAFQLVLNVKDSSKKVTDYEVIQQINKLDSFLMSDYGLKQTFSLPFVLKMANRTEHGGQNKYFKLPNKKQTQKFLKKIKKFDKGGQLSQFVDSTGKFARISSTLGDKGRYIISEKNERLFNFINTNIDTDLLDIQLTGTGHLLDKNMSKLANSLTKGLFFAVLLVSLLMGILYKSVKIVLLALIPNILPLIMLGGILGYLGIDLKVSTAIIFTISFGIAVDDTIHFMSKFKLELNKGKSILYALKRTYLSTGRAIVLTTLILCSGFLLLMFSDFLGTYYIGLLISLTLLFALVADMVVLPVLIILFYKSNTNILD
jgi:hypothetical protein